MTTSRTRWICGAIAIFLALAASAGPPMFKQNNRSYGSWVDGGSCTNLENGYRCRAIQAWENYDLKGAYEYTEASFHTWSYQHDPSDDSYEESWRVLSCPVDGKSIAAHRNRVTIDVTLDTEDPACYHYGERHTWDRVNGDQWFPLSFSPGVRAFEGEWMDPFNHGTSNWQQHDTSFDGWSGTTTRSVHHCMGRWGDMMTRGGFYITGVSGNVRFYEFTGPDGPAWGSFNVSSCNDKDRQN